MRLHPIFSLPRDLVGMHYAVRILLGSAILWLILQWISNNTPLWAIISLIMVTEPHMHSAWLNFKARMINTVAGCVVGLFFLLFVGHHNWELPIAMTITVLISSYMIRMSVGWRIAPITTAIIMAAGMAETTTIGGLSIALDRMMEVFLGSATALFVTWVMTKIWAHDSGKHTKK